jgi:amino acid adenylation domain-containing protein
MGAGEKTTHLLEDQLRIRGKCYHPNGAFEEFKGEEVEQSIPARFESIARRYPDRLAVKTEVHELSYQELNERANRLARTILDTGTEQAQPVGLLLEHGALPIVAMLGVLKAGRFFLPLDPTYPQSMLAGILHDSDPGLLIVDNSGFRNLGEVVHREGQACINMDDLTASTEDSNLGLDISPHSLSWLVYTSGSTGKPKGVMQAHRNQLHYARVRSNNWHISPEDKVCCPYSFAFSAAMWNIFDSLLIGAALLPFNLKAEGSSRLGTWMVNEEITISPFVSSMFRHFADDLDDDWCSPYLRFVKLGTERVDKSEVELYRRRFPSHCILATGLGSTETGPVRCFFMDHLSDIPDEGIPVGYETEGSEIIILGDDHNPVGPDQIGQIAVKGNFLSLGYWRQPDLTKERFLPDPEGKGERTYLTGDLGLMRPDGCLFHMGRNDSQMKIRGYRVEVGQVEEAILGVENIRDAAVKAIDDRGPDKCLVGYYVTGTDKTVTASVLRRTLERKLPDYMVPSVFVRMEALPQTPTGKLDRNALPDPGHERPELDTPYEGPRTPVEESLTAIWADVLGLDQVGVHDDFRDLGGSSLMAGQVISRVMHTFNVELQMKVLLESSTIAEMATLVTQSMIERFDERDLEQMLEEME